MPLISPNTDESRSNFISRFMSNETAKKDFPNIKQRLAVANQKWESSKKNLSIFSDNKQTVSESDILSNTIKEIGSK